MKREHVFRIATINMDIQKQEPDNEVEWAVRDIVTGMKEEPTMRKGK